MSNKLDKLIIANIDTFSKPEMTEEEKARPKDYRAIVAVNDAGDVLVLMNTTDCDLVDLFINGRDYDDNCIELHGAEAGTVGLYEVDLRPWSHKTYEGDYDFGIEATVTKKLSEIPYNHFGDNEDDEPVPDTL